MADFKELIDSIRKESVTLFLGSGFSKKAGAPMASAITDALYEALPSEVQEDCKEQKLLDVVSQKFEEVFGRPELISKLESVMSFRPTDTSDHTCLTRFPHFHHIITTNYDTLVEDAYGDKCYVVRTTDDVAALPKDKTIVYKIHGDFKAKDHILLTKQDYTNFFTDNSEPLLWKYIQSHILTNDILFIGYSLEDSNIYALIQEIRKNVKHDSRRYFLIAPNLKLYIIEKFAKTKIIYYDAKAEDLFQALSDTLDKQIKNDYQKKRISFETFSRYCSQHLLQPIVKEELDCNKIIKFDSNEQKNVSINMTGISKEIADAIINHDTTKYHSFVPNTHIPALRLTPDMMKELSISINGLTVGNKDDYQSLLIAPLYENIDTSIRIPSIKFNEKVTLQQYSPNKEQVCLLLETAAYTLKMIFFTSQNRDINCTCIVNFKEKIMNLQNAIKWMDLIIALWGGEEVKIKKYEQLPLIFPEKKELEVNNFKKIKKYFENVKEIENIYEREFETVFMCSEELFQLSELLIHSYYEHNLREKLNNQEYTIDIEGEQSEMWNSIEVGEDQYGIGITQYAQENVEFNGLKFDLKQKNTIIPQCQVLDISRSKGKVSQLRIKVLSDYAIVKYSNEELN